MTPTRIFSLSYGLRDPTISFRPVTRTRKGAHGAHAPHDPRPPPPADSLAAAGRRPLPPGPTGAGDSLLRRALREPAAVRLTTAPRQGQALPLASRPLRATASTV